MLSHVEFLVNHHSQVLLLSDTLNPLSDQPLFVLRIALTQMLDCTLDPVALHEVYTGPHLKTAEVPLDGIASLQCGDCTMQLGAIGKLTEGALNPAVHVAKQDVKQRQSQYPTPEECHSSLVSTWMLSHWLQHFKCNHLAIF